MNRLPLVLLILGASSLPAHADEPKRTLTFQSAIELSLGENPDVVIARDAIAGAEAHAAGTSAHRLASLSVNASGNRWRQPYSLPFGGTTFQLHGLDTSTTVVTIMQPLTGLAYLTELVGAADHETESTRADYDRVRLDTAYRTAEAYIRLLQARASADVAHRSVGDIQSELDRAKQLRAAETYTDIDVLRFQSAKSAADQIALRADTEIESALASLTVQLGLHDGAAIDIADDLPTTPPPLAMTLEAAQHRALAARPELRAAQEKIAAAANSRLAARERYLPDIRAVAAWNHLTGVQPFEPEDEEYVGLTFAWNVWDWGATHQAVLEAEHAEAHATLTEAALVDQVRLDVRKRWLDARTSYDSLAVAQTQLETAEEATRGLQKVSIRHNAAATTTDVLDAETDVSRALGLGFRGRARCGRLLPQARRPRPLGRRSTEARQVAAQELRDRPRLERTTDGPMRPIALADLRQMAEARELGGRATARRSANVLRAWPRRYHRAREPMRRRTRRRATATPSRRDTRDRARPGRRGNGRDTAARRGRANAARPVSPACGRPCRRPHARGRLR